MFTLVMIVPATALYPCRSASDDAMFKSHVVSVSQHNVDASRCDVGREMSEFAPKRKLHMPFGILI